MDNKVIKDKIGQEITVGCYIAYGHALGRCAGIRIGKVLDISVKNEKHRWKDEEVPTYRIRVRGVDDDWEWNGPKLNQRDGILQFPSRMIVLPENQVPQLYKELLSKV